MIPSRRWAVSENMGKSYELCISSQLSNLATVAEFVAHSASLAGLDEDQVFAVQMAVDEACTNTMEHAYEGRQDGEVFICCYLEGGDFVVRITDHGKPFEPASIPSPDVSSPLEERGVGGLGIFFMRRLMDSVEFRFDAIRGNEVTMRKRRRG